MNWIYDTHIHLSDLAYESYFPFILNSMKKIHLKACCVSMDYTSAKTTLELGKKSDLIFPFIGIHPEKANDSIESILTLIEENKEQISGIGEIGLDDTYSDSDEELSRQEEIFRTQLSLAEKLKKPVSIHSRKTLDKIFKILPSYNVPNVLLHWFDGNKKQLRNAMDLGCFVSFGPVMVYSQDKQVLLTKADKDKILVETDGPVRFSRCFGYKEAQVSFIPSVIFSASKVLGVTYNELSEILEQNSKSYLDI